jgi:hypothetical protein
VSWVNGNSDNEKQSGFWALNNSFGRYVAGSILSKSKQTSAATVTDNDFVVPFINGYGVRPN